MANTCSFPYGRRSFGFSNGVRSLIWWKASQRGGHEFGLHWFDAVSQNESSGQQWEFEQARFTPQPPQSTFPPQLLETGPHTTADERRLGPLGYIKLPGHGWALG